MRAAEAKAGKSKIEMKSTATLLASSEPRDRAELAWRTAVPVMALVLMVLAVPLARLRPRQGRFARAATPCSRTSHSNLLAACACRSRRIPPAASSALVGPPRAARVCRLAALERTPSRQAVAPALEASCCPRCGGRLRPCRNDGILGRYVVRTVLGYTALVMIVLLALGALFMFIGQQDDIGVGNYTATQALLFVALNLPSYLFQLLPVAALIGSLLGLGNLARGSELIVMRSSGVTTLRFCVWLGTAGLLLASLMFVVGEYVAPPLGSYARQLKVFASSTSSILPATAPRGCAMATRSSASTSSRPARVSAASRCSGSIPRASSSVSAAPSRPA